MLGLSTGLMYQGIFGEAGLSPNEINDTTGHTCLAWYDFTDATTMYTDAGSTNVSSDDDAIHRITNKSSASGGDRYTTYLQQPNGSAYKPKYKVGGQGGKSYANFDGNYTYIGGNRDNTGTRVGNAGSSNNFSDQNDIQSDEIAVFFVSAGYEAADPGPSNFRRAVFGFRNWQGTGNDDKVHMYAYNDALTSPFATHDVFFQLDPDTGSNVGGETQPPILGATSDFKIASFLTEENGSEYLTIGNNVGDTSTKFTLSGTDYYHHGTSSFNTFEIDFSTTSNNNYFRIGADGNDTTGITQLWTGRIYEVIIMKGDMYTDGTYQDIINYLTNKYGNNGEGYAP
jgi:hypothetical protein